MQADGAEKKPYVKSVRSRIEDIVPGMAVAEDIKNTAGGIIVAADTFLTSSHIQKLKECGIDRLYIQTCDMNKEFDPLRNKRAVVVDDSLFFRHMFSKMLYRMGMFVCGESPTAEEGLEAVSVYSPELVVMDIHLPKMDGRLAIKQIHRKMPQTKILAVSTDKEKAVIIEAFRAGANDFIVKPIKWDILKPRIINLFPVKESSVNH
ncbi:MAG TPA: response regulator [bacterium]|nr:response regulator [bacterium]